LLLSRTSRSLALAGALAAAVLAAAPALAQHRGGPGPGGSGGFAPGMDIVGTRPRMGDRGPAITAPVRIEPQLGPPSRWWDDKSTIRRLNLRTDQQRRMDEIFEGNKQNLTNLYTNLQREEARLVSLPPADLQDEGKVFAAIDRVAQARSDLEKARAHTLLQIRQQMDPAQLSELDREMASLR
jgi:Spy/CpxP family protein refolding chaperone